MKKQTVLVSNDDGPASPGVQALISALSSFSHVIPVIPEGPRSGTSMSLTFHKPLRIREIVISNTKGFAVSGSPADAVMVALYRILKERPSAMASGINIGDNTGLQDIFASGTVQAAIQSAFLGIPSVAFSLEINEGAIFSPSEAIGNFGAAAKHAARIMQWVSRNGLPKGIDILNVNFPAGVSDKTKVQFTRLAPKKYENYVVQRMDPRGKPYYWVWGHRAEKYAEGTDAKAVLNDSKISITPLRVDMSVSSSGLSGLAEYLEEGRGS
jgi:5'-nucleotidase